MHLGWTRRAVRFPSGPISLPCDQAPTAGQAAGGRGGKADAAVLKTAGGQPPCGFESRRPHPKNDAVPFHQAGPRQGRGRLARPAADPTATRSASAVVFVPLRIAAAPPAHHRRAAAMPPRKQSAGCTPKLLVVHLHVHPPVEQQLRASAPQILEPDRRQPRRGGVNPPARRTSAEDGRFDARRFEQVPPSCPAVIPEEQPDGRGADPRTDPSDDSGAGRGAPSNRWRPLGNTSVTASRRNRHAAAASP